jgi:hypothetical protein
MVRRPDAQSRSERSGTGRAHRGAGELTEKKEKLKAQLASSERPHDRGRENKGINAVVRNLGIDRIEA